MEKIKYPSENYSVYENGDSSVDRFDKDGFLRSTAYKDNRGRLHRLDYPALTSYFPSGNKKDEGYFLHGKAHRNPFEGPAFISYKEDGSIIVASLWWYENNCVAEIKFPFMIINDEIYKLSKHLINHLEMFPTPKYPNSLEKYTPSQEEIFDFIFTYNREAGIKMKTIVDKINDKNKEY